MLALGFIVLLAAILSGLGWPLVRKLDKTAECGDGLRLFISFVVGAMALAIVVEIVGRYRLDGLSMTILLAVSSLAALPGLMSMPWKAWRDGVVIQTKTDLWSRVLWLLVIMVGGSSLLQGMAPPNDYDSLMYHLAIPRLDVERGVIGPAWEHELVHAFFPQMLGNLYRLTLAVMGEKPVQMVHGLFGLIAAASAGILVLRMGFGRRTALLATLMFLSIRGVVWQMATAEVDVASGALLGVALLTFMTWQRSAHMGHALLFGAMLAGGLWVKYHGGAVAIAFAVPVITALIRRQVSLIQTIGVGLAALAAFSPHMIRDYLYTGNPLFPLFNTLFNPQDPTFFENYQDVLGIGREFWHLLVTPVALFELPTHYFDGMVMGAPYLLAFLPACGLAKGRIRSWFTPLGVALVFYVEWFYLLSQQVRFLAAIWPVMSCFAAIGATALWQAAAPLKAARVAIIGISAVLVIAQMGFVAIYSALRLPSAVGLMSAETYHTKTPTLTGAFFVTCSYIRDHLEPGQSYLSLITPHSYYCPQASMVQNYRSEAEAQSWRHGQALPPLTIPEAIQAFQQRDFRFVIVMTAEEWRAGQFSATTVHKVDFASQYRFGPAVAAGIKGLKPLIEDNKASVYDGREVLRNMLQQVNGQKP